MAKPFKRTCQLGLLAKDLLALRRHPRGTSGRTPRAQAVVDRLGLLHGLPQKIGQLMAFSDLADGDASFSRLTEGRASMPPREAFDTMESQLRRPLSECFSWVDTQGISASIGQVHRARTRDGQDVAIKIQYPEIADQIDWDLQALGWLSAPLGDLRKGFALEAYRQEIGEMLRAELDYRQEAESIRFFETQSRSFTCIQVPQVLSELSGPQILTTTWIDGAAVSTAQPWPAADRSLVANALGRFFLHSLLSWRLLHADPHPGNYRFQPRSERHGPRVGLIDFGCVKPVSTTLAHGLAQLLEKGMTQALTPDLVLNALAGMGFQEAALRSMHSKLVPIAEALCFPFQSPNPVSVREWALGKRLADILKEDRTRFRTSGSPQLIYVLRSLQGVLRHLNCLDAPVAWRDHLDSLDGVTAAIESKKPAQTPCPSPNPMKSESLHIQVSESGCTKVALTFSAEAAAHLAQLIPVDYRERVRRHDINLHEIADRARSTGYPPGPLLDLQEGSKSVRVWLA